uniref:DUF4139 domain-containing protein n=1 Tax=Romanomermis culicivorax TaxID=13658 RepID=A0A915IB42_ROMCU
MDPASGASPASAAPPSDCDSASKCGTAQRVRPGPANAGRPSNGRRSLPIPGYVLVPALVILDPPYIHFKGTMDKKSLTEFVDSYLDYYAIRAKKIDEEIAEVERAMEAYKDDIKKLTKDVNWDQNSEITNMPAKIEIRLKAAEKLDIEIEVKYVVMDASWEPRYDMWIEKGADFIRLVYYGFVKQNTDEDWDDIGNLVLSNAQTQTNMGDIPLQYVINVATEKTKENVELVAEFPEQKPSVPQRNEALPKIRKDVQVSRFDTSERKHFSYVFSPHDLMRPTSSKAHKSSENKGSSGPFVIPTKPKIKSDNTTHSVTIASLDLPATFEYESIPSQASHAYTKVTITNSSMFLLLAGRVSLYLDEYFLTSNRIENVGASEQFCFTLCVDSSVRVLYKTGRSNQIVSGFFNKVITDVRTKEVYIKNNSSKPIRITVIEPLPKSVDSNVKVS